MDKFIKAGSSITHSDVFNDTSCAFVREYIVGENAQFFYTGICVGGNATKNISLSFILECNASAVIELLVINTNAVVEVHCVMRGQLSQAVVHGAYVVNQSNVVRMNTQQHHEAAHTNSTLVLRGIVDDNAQAMYSGMIRVEKEARGCVSSQENKNILLHNGARALSVPSLEVLTNEVHCFHGSATAQFDDNHFFYAASRGIDHLDMRRLLVEAFFAGMFSNKEVITLLKGLL